MKLKVRERDVVKSIQQYLKIRGYLFIRNNTGMTFLTNQDGRRRAIRMGSTGWPDLIGMSKGGTFVGIECKSDTGKISPEQQAIGDQIVKSKGYWFVARSVDDVIDRGF